MKKKLYNTLFALFLLCASALAGEKTKNDGGANKVFTGSNWYIEVGGGAQVLFSKDASFLDFGKRVTPAISITGGKWLSPFYGIRLQVQGYSFNGFSTTEGVYVGDPLQNGLVYGPNDPVRGEVPIRPDGSYRYYLRYVNAHADFQISLANLFGGYKPERKWDIIPAIGLGYLRTFSYKGTANMNSISTNFSLMGKYRLPKGFDINLEAQTALMSDRFDGRIAGKPYENSASLTLGITYNFNRKTGKMPQTKINETELKESLREIIREELATQVPITCHTSGVKDTVIIKEVSKEVLKTKEGPFTLASVLFDTGKIKPISGQDIQFVNIAEYMKKYPESKIRLEGYADKQTGNENTNLRLSMKRAMNIRQTLIDKYGINEKRIETQGIGINYQPYEENDWNRVVIVKVVD